MMLINCKKTYKYSILKMNVQIFRFNAQIKIINRKINMKNGTELESLTECVINYCM